jgi:hypothetical protein
VSSADAQNAGRTTHNASKGREVEEWVDLHFFRPIGIRIARALAPTSVSPDQVTLWSLIVGLAAGHCFVYASPWANLLGFALFIISDLFDSADGQLARLRGTSTQFGRILDGLSDNARFANLYIHVIVRLVHHDGWSVWPALALAVAAGLSHSWQSAAIDCIRNAYLELGVGGGGELELPEDVRPSLLHDDHSMFRRIGRAAYRAYVRRQQLLCPVTTRLVRRVRAVDAEGASETVAQAQSEFRESERSVVRQCAWLGQNIRFPLVAIPGIVGHIAGFLWLTVIPLNLILVALLVTHERRARRALLAIDDAPVLAAAR